eukprot:scaffold11726_cov161-Skeletonema_menzelii.AAC.6
MCTAAIIKSISSRSIALYSQHDHLHYSHAIDCSHSIISIVSINWSASSQQRYYLNLKAYPTTYSTTLYNVTVITTHPSHTREERIDSKSNATSATKPNHQAGTHPLTPNLVDLNEEDYPNDNGRPIGFFLVPPPAIGSNVAAAADTAMPTRRCSRKRVAISPPSSPRRILYPRPLKKMKVLNFDKAIR